MTTSELKKRQEAVFHALDKTSVSGYQNVLNMAASMQLLYDLIHDDIQLDTTTNNK